jgi:hypothetical protein
MNGDYPWPSYAPLVLAAASTLAGRRTAAYPALEPDVVAAGAEFVDGSAVVDGQLVSARAWPDHPAWMRELAKIPRAKAPADSRCGRDLFHVKPGAAPAAVSRETGHR